MDKEKLIEFYEKKVVITIYLKNGFHYTGTVVEFGDTIVFLDKFNKRIPIECAVISYAVPHGGDEE